MKFAVCINNKSYEASLEKGKIYQIIKDTESKNLNLLRIIDESGEDYLFSKEYFLPITLPKKIEKALV